MLDSYRYRRLDADARAFAAGFLLLLPFYLAPIYVTRFLPGLDLPFHLSMVDMLMKQGQPSNPYHPFYEGGFAVAPYAAHYLALRLLALALPLMTAHKLLVAIYVAAFPLTAALLLGACGRSRVPALLVFPLTYNLALHYGFVSFAFSLPCVLLLLALLALFLVETKTNLWLGGGAALAAILLFLCHLQNFLFGVCAALAFVAFAACNWRRRLLGMLTLVPSAALLLTWNLTRLYDSPAAGNRTWAALWQLIEARRRSEQGGHTWQKEILLRIEGIPIHLLRGFTDEVDVVFSRIILFVLAGYLLLGLVGLALGRAQPAPAPRPRLWLAGLAVFAGALFAYLMLPHHLPEYELMTAYPRFSVLVGATALLLVPASLRRLDGILRPMLLLPALLPTIVYAGELVRHYRYYDQEVADFDAVVKKTPPGGRALGLVFDRQSRVMRIESALIGLPSLYPVLKPAAAAMVPLPYCGMRHMPCTRLSPPIPLPAPSAWSPSTLNAAAAIDFFDYFFIRLPPRAPIFGEGLLRLELIAQQGSWLVYRRRPAAPAGPRAGVQ